MVGWRGLAALENDGRMSAVDVGDVHPSAGRRLDVRRAEMLRHQRLAARHLDGAAANAGSSAAERLGGRRELLVSGRRRDQNAAERDLVVQPQRSPLERHLLLARRHHGGHHPVPGLSESIRGMILLMDFFSSSAFTHFFTFSKSFIVFYFDGRVDVPLGSGGK